MRTAAFFGAVLVIVVCALTGNGVTGQDKEVPISKEFAIIHLDQNGKPTASETSISTSKTEIHVTVKVSGPMDPDPLLGKTVTIAQFIDGAVEDIVGNKPSLSKTSGGSEAEVIFRKPPKGVYIYMILLDGRQTEVFFVLNVTA